jgi:hypothetical protein
VSRNSLLLRVPSAIVPETSNILLNPNIRKANLDSLARQSIRWDERLLALPLTRLNASFCSEFPHYPVGGFYEVLEMDRGYDSRTFDCE